MKSRLASSSASEHSTAAASSTQQNGATPPDPFEGEGYKEVGSIRRGTAQEEDDEFDYAFEGGKREGFHTMVFQGKPMPAHLVSRVREEPLNMVHEDEEAELAEEAEEEEEQGIVIDDSPEDASNLSHMPSVGQPVLRSMSHSTAGKEDGLLDREGSEYGTSPQPRSSSVQSNQVLEEEEEEDDAQGGSGMLSHCQGTSQDNTSPSHAMHSVLRDACEQGEFSRISTARGPRHSGEGSRGSGWSTFVASEANSQPAGHEGEMPQAGDDGMYNNELFGDPSPPPNEDLPSLKLLKKLSCEEHKLSSIQEGSTVTGGGAAAWKESHSPHSNDHPSITPNRVSFRDPKSCSSKDLRLRSESAATADDAMEEDGQPPDTGDARGSPLFDTSLFAGAQEFDRHKGQAAGSSSSSLSLSKLALLEEHITQRSSSNLQSPHASRHPGSQRSSTFNTHDSKHPYGHQRRMLHLGASHSARDLGPRSAASSAAAAAGAAAMAALDSSCSHDPALQANGQSPSSQSTQHNSLLGVSALSALARSATARSTALSAQYTQGSGLAGSSEAGHSSAPDVHQRSSAEQGPEGLSDDNSAIGSDRRSPLQQPRILRVSPPPPTPAQQQASAASPAAPQQQSASASPAAGTRSAGQGAGTAAGTPAQSYQLQGSGEGPAGGSGGGGAQGTELGEDDVEMELEVGTAGPGEGVGEDGEEPRKSGSGKYAVANGGPADPVPVQKQGADSGGQERAGQGAGIGKGSPARPSASDAQGRADAGKAASLSVQQQQARKGEAARTEAGGPSVSAQSVPEKSMAGAPAGSAARPAQGQHAMEGRGAAGSSSSPAQGEEDEWEIANQQRLLELMSMGASDIHRKRVGQSVSQPAFEVVSYHEALLHFMTTPLDERARMTAEQLLPPPPTLFQRILCLAAPKLKPLYKEQQVGGRLREQQIRLLCLARVPFNEEDPMHLKLLQSLYACYTGKTSIAPPRYGSHWAEIGFQGNDPATDLRGCGMLGLLQLASLFQHSRANAAKLYKLSTSTHQEFPLAIVSINITKFMLQALRSGALNTASHDLDSAVEAANHFYAGTFFTFHDIWLSGNKTMAQSGFVIKELQELCQKKPSKMVAAAHKTL